MTLLEFNQIHRLVGGGGGGRWREPRCNGGGKSAGGEERVGDGIPKGVGGAGRDRKEFCNLAQFFAIEIAYRGGNH